MVDVLQVARARRAELIAELEKLDWFLVKAEELLKEAPKSAPVAEAPAVATPVMEPTPVSPDEVQKNMRASMRFSAEMKAQAAAPAMTRPVDAILFKKLGETLREKNAPKVPETGPELPQKIVATG